MRIMPPFGDLHSIAYRRDVLEKKLTPDPRN